MKGELWAWHDFDRDEYHMVYNRRFLVKICSPDFFKKRTELGEGKIVKLKVIEVVDSEEATNDRDK